MMNALRVVKESATSATSLTITKASIPTPEAGSVLVKINATAINPSDTMNAAGGFPYTTFPRIPGRDFAGVVVDPVSSHLHGQQVYATSGRYLSFSEDGAHAEYCLVREEALAPMPKNLTFAQAASVGVPFTTALIALERAQVTRTDTVLVLGAAGSVGSAAVQLARTKGCKVITASRRATTDINILDDPQLAKAKELTDGKGPSIIIDTVGDVKLMLVAMDVLAFRGRISYIAAPKTGNTDFTFNMLQAYRKEQMIIGVNSLNYTGEEMGTILRQLTPQFESGALKPVEDSKLFKVAIEDAVDAYAKVKARKGDKYVIHFA